MFFSKSKVTVLCSIHYIYPFKEAGFCYKLIGKIYLKPPLQNLANRPFEKL